MNYLMINLEAMKNIPKNKWDESRKFEYSEIIQKLFGKIFQILKSDVNINVANRKIFYTLHQERLKIL